MHWLHVWCPCATYNRSSERYITCARNGFQCWNADRWLDFCLEDLHQRSYLTFEMAWRSSLQCRDEWWPVCRERDIVLMRSGARRLQCVEVRLTLASVHLPAWSSGPPTTAQVGTRSQRCTGNLNCKPLVHVMSYVISASVLTWWLETPGGSVPCL